LHVLAAKVRRLYDIANVLSSIGLIEKIHLVEVRKPAFKWVGKTEFSDELLRSAEQGAAGVARVAGSASWGTRGGRGASAGGASAGGALQGSRGRSMSGLGAEADGDGAAPSVGRKRRTPAVRDGLALLKEAAQVKRPRVSGPRRRGANGGAGGLGSASPGDAGALTFSFSPAQDGTLPRFGAAASPEFVPRFEALPPLDMPILYTADPSDLARGSVQGPLLLHPNLPAGPQRAPYVDVIVRDLNGFLQDYHRALVTWRRHVPTLQLEVQRMPHLGTASYTEVIVPKPLALA
jgi:hypothetical protein